MPEPTEQQQKPDIPGGTPPAARLSPLPMALAAALFLTVIAADAHAGMVYGQITIPGGAPYNGTTMLESSDGERKRIMVDHRGNYRISLPPGYYRVIHRNPRSGTVYEGWLSSAPNASRQDVRMVPAR